MSFDALMTMNALGLTGAERLVFFVLEAHADDETGRLDTTTRRILRDLGGMAKTTFVTRVTELAESHAVLDLSWNDSMSEFGLNVAALSMRPA